MKLNFRKFLDILLMAGLLIQMMYIYVDEKLHECLGVVMFLLVAIHIILNRKWIKNVLKGSYNLIRFIQLVINISLLTCIFMLIISGIVISGHIFSFMNIQKGMSIARLVHMVAAYWSFLFMSIHLGFHLGMFIGIFTNNSDSSIWRKSVLNLLGFVIFIIGIYYFHEQNIISYLLLKNQFVFFDISIPVNLYLMRWLMIMSAFMYLGYQSKKRMIMKN